MTREYKPKLEGLELEQARLFHVLKIKEKLKRGTWFKGRTEMPLSSAKKKRLAEALSYLEKAIEKGVKINGK